MWTPSLRNIRTSIWVSFGPTPAWCTLSKREDAHTCSRTLLGPARNHTTQKYQTLKSNVLRLHISKRQLYPRQDACNESSCRGFLSTMNTLHKLIALAIAAIGSICNHADGARPPRVTHPDSLHLLPQNLWELPENPWSEARRNSIERLTNEGLPRGCRRTRHRDYRHESCRSNRGRLNPPGILCSGKAID